MNTMHHEAAKVNPDAIIWGQCSPYHCPLPTDPPAECEPVGPGTADEAFRLAELPSATEGGCGATELSPEERAMEALTVTSWRHYEALADESEAMDRIEAGVMGW